MPQELIQTEENANDFWRRWLYEDDPNPPTAIVFHDQRSPGKQCLFRSETPLIYNTLSDEPGACKGPEEDPGRSSLVVWLAGVSAGVRE